MDLGEGRRDGGTGDQGSRIKDQEPGQKQNARPAVGGRRGPERALPAGSAASAKPGAAVKPEPVGAHPRLQRAGARC
jgi:hypothetical protein